MARAIGAHMTCPNCGAAVADNRRFCGKCGRDLAPEVSTDPPVAPPPYAGPQGSPPSAWGTGGAIASSAPPPGQPSAPPGVADPFAPPNLDPPGYPGYPPAPGYGPPPAYPYPPPGYPGGAPGWPPYGYGPPRTNGLAIASLVLGLAGWMFCGIGSVVAIVLGFISRGQIKQSAGREVGSGMATAGIVLGFVALAFLIAYFIVVGLLANSS